MRFETTLEITPVYCLNHSVQYRAPGLFVTLSGDIRPGEKPNDEAVRRAKARSRLSDFPLRGGDGWDFRIEGRYIRRVA